MGIAQSLFLAERTLQKLVGIVILQISCIIQNMLAAESGHSGPHPTELSHPEDYPSIHDAEAAAPGTEPQTDTATEENPGTLPNLSFRERVGHASIGVGVLGLIAEGQRIVENAPLPNHLIPLGGIALAAAGLVWARMRGRRSR
jgi:hypothetical protein